MLIPRLAQAYDALPPSDPLKVRLKDQVATLRAWDDRWSESSVETSLAVFWGEALWAKASPQAQAAKSNVYDWLAHKSAGAEMLAALSDASNQLRQGFGSWRTSWGEINRFQRLDDAIAPHFSDEAPSLPVPFTSSRWGSLASLGAHAYPGIQRWYGSGGNSFVAVVELGPKVRARRHRRWRERRSAFTPLRRPSRPLRLRPAPPRLRLPRGPDRPHGAHLPSRIVIGLLHTARSFRLDQRTRGPAACLWADRASPATGSGT